MVFSTTKYLFNISLQQGGFSDKLKITCVTFIFKNGDKSLFKNCKPYSALPCFPKLLEPIMYNRIYEFLIKK